MNLQPGEVRFAWVLLFLLALMAFPWVSRPGPIVLITAAIGFLPGALILASRTRTMRMAGEVENLLATSIGRISVALGLAIAALIAVIFDVFVATFLVALTTEIMWLVLLVSPRSSLPRFFPGGMLAAGTTLILLIATDTTLNWGPVARRLGTPSERARWKEHYARAKQKNLFQFRSPYEDTRRRRGVRRIIALGDSFTEGFGIWSSDSTWPAQLERELNRGLDSASTEVLNMGRSGFTTGSEAELLRRLGWQFDPDLVIVQWLSNDISPTCPNLRICGAAVHVTLVPARFRTGLIQGSAILFLLERYLSAVLNPTPVELYVPASSQWHALQAALKEMVDSAAQRCVPLMFVAYPYLFPGRWTSATYPERQLMDLVIEDARRDGAEVLDLLPTFVEANRPGESWWAAPYDPHPSAAANHLAILSMARFIRERNLLPHRRDKDQSKDTMQTGGETGHPATLSGRSAGPGRPVGFIRLTGGRRWVGSIRRLDRYDVDPGGWLVAPAPPPEWRAAEAARLAVVARPYAWVLAAYQQPGAVDALVASARDLGAHVVWSHQTDDALLRLRFPVRPEPSARR